MRYRIFKIFESVFVCNMQVVNPSMLLMSYLIHKPSKLLQNNSEFWYVDAWSSNFTWGGASPPGEGEFVVVPEGQLLLLDESTPVLKMLLIMGGELLFDEQVCC